MTSSPGTRPAPDLPPGPRAALVVATGRYTAGLAPLAATARDAAEMAAVLADPGIGGFAVTPVLDGGAQQIKLAAEDFLTGRGRDDLVLVYLSGHGLLDARDRLYFAATDTRQDRLAATGVEAAWLLDLLDECRAVSQVVILDCCYSGAFGRAGAKGAAEGAAEADLRLGQRLATHGRGRAVLTASRAEQRAWVNRSNGPESAGSVFTSALARGLRTGAADLDQDGWISVEDAYGHAYQQVIDSNTGQVPQRWLSGGEGAIVLARSPAGIPSTETGPAQLAEAPNSLPDHLRTALDSPLPAIRIGAVNALGKWLAASDPARAQAAWHLLERIVAEDILEVAETARALLRVSTSTSADPLSPAETLAPPACGVSPQETQVENTVSDPWQKWYRQDPGVRTSADNDGHRSRPSQPMIQRSQPLFTLSHGQVHNVWDGDHHYTIAFSPDGHLLAATCSDGKVRLWNPVKGKRVRTLKSSSPLRTLAFSSNKSLLVTSADHGAQFWDSNRGKHLHHLFILGGTVLAMVFSADDHWFATTSDDKLVQVWARDYTRSLKPAQQFASQAALRHPDVVLAVAFHPHMPLLATGGRDRIARLWDVPSGQLLHTLTGHDSWIKGVAFSPAGNLLATASADHTVRLWNTATGELADVFSDFADGVHTVAFSPDGGMLATGSGNAAQIWDAATGEQRYELNGHSGGVHGVAFSPDGLLLATVGYDAQVLLWDWYRR